MKAATWNVNSLRVRLPQVLDWLEANRPDILGLQETKLEDEHFPLDAFREQGYQAVYSGQKTYNGVALLARETPADTVTDLDGMDDHQRRVLGATIGGVRVLNLYVPNGQSVDSDKYVYKLEWLSALREHLATELRRHPHMLVMGDFNIAPADEDVYDPDAWRGKVLCSEAEREALAAVEAAGLTDVFRSFSQPPGTYSWWDYRAAAFRRNRGLRIDLILASAALSGRCTACYVDRTPRGWERPSDHTPVVAEFGD